MPAVPAIIGAGGAIGSALLGSHAASSAMQMSPQEQAAYTSQTNLANQMQGQGAQLFGKAMPALTNTLNYYQTLMGKGGRTAAYAATAPAAENVSSVYGGAANNLLRSGVQGGERDTALADLNREKAGQMSRLVTGVQPMAAQGLAGLGTSLLGGAGSFEGGASGIYGNQTAMGAANRKLGLQAGGQTSAGFGGLIAQLMNIYKGKNVTSGMTGKSGSLLFDNSYGPQQQGGDYGGGSDGLWG